MFAVVENDEASCLPKLDKQRIIWYKPLLKPSPMFTTPTPLDDAAELGVFRPLSANDDLVLARLGVPEDRLASERASPGMVGGAKPAF